MYTAHHRKDTNMTFAEAAAMVAACAPPRPPKPEPMTVHPAVVKLAKEFKAAMR